jgi:hypothetical protein
MIFLTIRIQQCTNVKKFAFLQSLYDLHFKCIFHKQAGSEIKVKVQSGSGKKKKKFRIHNTHS